MYVIVAGVNTISRRLIEDLVKNHDVVVVEEDEKEAESIYHTGATVVNGSPSSLSVLEDAGVSKADVLVSTLSQPNRNMVISMIGKKFGVPKIVARVEDKGYSDIYDMLEINTVEYTDIVYSEFLSVIEHPSMRKIANVGADKEIIEMVVSEGSRFLNLRIDEVPEIREYPENKAEIVSVLREGDVKKPSDTLRLKKGDSMIMIVEKDARSEMNKIF